MAAQVAGGMPRRPNQNSVTTDARDGRSLFYPSSATVCHQGDEGDALFIVRRGQVALSVQQGKTNKRLAILGEGEFFGELSLLDGQPHSVTAQTLCDTQLIRLPREHFLATLADPEALREVLREYPESAYVFISERGAPMTAATFRKLVARAGDAAKLGMPIHPHMLRHSTGFKLANDGQDTHAIQLYLGHILP